MPYFVNQGRTVRNDKVGGKVNERRMRMKESRRVWLARLLL